MSGVWAQWGSMWKCTEADQSSYSQHKGSGGEIQEPVVGGVGFLPRPAPWSRSLPGLTPTEAPLDMCSPSSVSCFTGAFSAQISAASLPPTKCSCSAPTER